ncbi:amino acid/amide ABC transporter substrate-binding protein, HAAT family [Noviherbaspirillum humi]|uniref:Amino acid/amide ABC transporter substrate-binding protein, HAAT family n=1 Tax=Noviherbaspirillum humi TaxID=1688639 RepID=A0A239I9R9_9BURK|nr:ABC transporter substrate-binding protein [Noviherbaspirillum humi]SNS90132.1 amino acid/amide ABC transporter substrate-binding protein, HAAT family [Noviherbaspirillum humi]
MIRLNALSGCLALALSAFAATAHADGNTIKIGMIAALTGENAPSGEQMKAGIETYLREHKGMLGGKKAEVIYRDDSARAEEAKRIATELVTRDKVDILTGFQFTPNAMASAAVADQAKKPMVVINAAASAVTTRSPYVTRVSYTIAQSVKPLADWAYKTGSRRVFSIVSDYAPGVDAETWFTKVFTAQGGQVIGAVRVPMNTQDYSAYLQRIKDEKPDAIHLFLPNGQPMITFMKAFRQKELDKSGIRVLAGEGWGDEEVLKPAGDAAVGIYTAGFYSYTQPNAENQKFLQSFAKTVNDRVKPSFMGAAAYDAMALIDAALTKTNGNPSGEAFMSAVKGYSNSSSPRGVVRIDPETRDIVQNIYIRRIEKKGSEYVTTEVARYENVKDPAKEK